MPDSAPISVMQMSLAMFVSMTCEIMQVRMHTPHGIATSSARLITHSRKM